MKHPYGSCFLLTLLKKQVPGPCWLLLAVLLNTAALRPAAAQVGSRSPLPSYFTADAAANQAAARSPLLPRLQHYRAYTLDLAGLRTALVIAPQRSALAAPPLVLSLPLPDGTTQRFAVWEAPLLAPALAAQYPLLHTYGGRGLDDPTALLSLTISPGSFQAQILTEQGQGSAYLEATAANDARHYLSYYAHDVIPPAGGVGGCGADLLPAVPQPAHRQSGPKDLGDGTSNLSSPVGPTLSVYRLVVATTKEYTNSVHNSANGTDYTDVMANVTSLINNVRTLQERDLAATMTLVNTHFYTTASDGGYDQTSDGQMIGQNITNANAEFGASAYDLGHVFATSGTGLAYVGVVGNSSYKAGAVSGNAGRNTPISYYATSIIAHEMGHQFSAFHTFNNCNGAHTATTAWEPGQGTTIMSYADAGCGANTNIISRTDSYYHTGSIEQMRTYIESIPGVGTQISSGNSTPTVVVPINRSIPQGTPFKLTATGADADAADVATLTYNWEELDLGSVANFATAQVANDNVPLFRSVVPTTSLATRYFPSLSNLGGSPTSSTSTAERLPTVARTLSLRCTVRDSHIVTGAAATATSSSIVGGVALSRTVVLTVSAANASPFAVTAPNSAVSWAGGSTQTVTWNGVGTKTSAVNCQTVNVRLSTNGGATYPTMLAAGVANVDGSGSTNITLPNVASTTARVMVEAADNYFFDISDANFTITAVAGPAITSLSPTSGVAGSTLTINGSGFGTSAAALGLTVGGATATISGTVADNSFSVAVPTTALTGAVVVTKTGTGAGTANGGVFQVTPVVLSVNPTAAPAGAAIVISGNSFDGATRVSFNGTETTAFTIDSGVSPNTIAVAVPAAATTGAVVVYTAGGASNSSVVFTVVPFAVSSLVPASNARAITESAAIAVTFNATAKATNNTLAPIKVTSLQAGGRKAGTTTVSGNTISFAPTASFRAGEVVQLSVTTAAVSGADAALAQPFVSQFTVRSRTRTSQAAASNPAVGADPEHVVTGDLNGDGMLDLVVVNTTDGTVSILLNNAAGTSYAPATTIAVGAAPRQAALADFNNDGNLDLIVACSGGSGTLCVLPGTGTGSFSAVNNLTNAGALWMVALSDLNGDGNLDVVIPMPYSNVGRMLIGLGTGNFATGNSGFSFSIYDGLDVAAAAVALADFDEDGKLDVASASNNVISVRLGNGAGSFTGSTNLPANGNNYVVAADLTGDGHIDLASANPYVSGSTLTVWAGTGTGSFGSATTLTLTSGYAYTLSTGDYNGDGTIDLIAPRTAYAAVAGVGAGVEIFTYNSSTSTFSGPTVVTSAGFGNGPTYVAVADLNNDRALDFVTANSTSANTVSVSLTVPNTPLPVELVSFAAERRGPAAVALIWHTASERHNAGFVVERSLEGKTFQAISSLLPGLGSSGKGQFYTHLDPAAPASLVYYRLRQVDEDGQTQYSPVAAVAALAGSPAMVQLFVYPNPAQQAAFVQLSGPVAAGAVVQVLDALGREVRHALAPAAGAVLEVSLRGLQAGLYVVRCGALKQQLVVE